MKILHISTSDTGGAGIAALRLHQGLLSQGVDSKFLCLHRSNNQCSEVYQFPKYYPRFYIRLLDRLGFRISKNVYQQKVLAKYDGEFAIFSFTETDYDVTEHHLFSNADIIVLHWIAGFLDYPSFFKKVKKPIVWYLHDLNPILGGFHYEFDIINNEDQEIKKLDKKIRKKKYDILRKKKLYIVGNSIWTVNKAKDYNVFHSSSTYTHISLSVDESIYFPINKSAAKTALSIKDNLFLICFGAENFFVKRKGLLPLVKSLKLVKEKSDNESIALICFGSGNTTELNSTGFPVYNIGFIDNDYLLRIIYSAADIFVIPSLDESFGQTTIEAMSCGTPVVGFDTGGIPEGILPNQTGLIANYKDIYDLSDKILELALDNEKRTKFGKNSREYILRNFTPNNQAIKFINLFSRILNN